MKILIVCGYGCNLDSPLRPYLDRVAAFCERERPTLIILCGGTTQKKSFPGVTESDVMYHYLYDKLDSLPDWHPGWWTEEDGFTTYDNIKQAGHLIWEWQQLRDELDPLDPEITIFCEATRALKVAILARRFIGFPPLCGLPPIRIETDSWEQMHPLKELVATLKDTLAITVPFLNTIQRRRRIAKSYQQ